LYKAFGSIVDYSSIFSTLASAQIVSCNTKAAQDKSETVMAGKYFRPLRVDTSASML
jgi:hypothetical protein